VCNNSPAESTSPENGWRWSGTPIPGRLRSSLRRRSRRKRVEGSWRLRGRLWAWAQPELPSVQILVVVANIQVRSLKTEVEKGSAWTAVDRGSVDPKAAANAVAHYGGGPSRVLTGCRKGSGLIFPHQAKERAVRKSGHARQRKRTRRRCVKPELEFSFLVEMPCPWKWFSLR
jgi:hypothetical protein